MARSFKQARQPKAKKVPANRKRAANDDDEGAGSSSQVVTKKVGKLKKVEVVEEKDPEDLEEVDDEESDVDDDDDDSDSKSGGKPENYELDFEGMEICQEDKKGIMSLLEQSFLRPDFPYDKFADELIANVPNGTVLVPADLDEEETGYPVFGLTVVHKINVDKEKPVEFDKKFMEFVAARAVNFAPKELARKIDEISKENGTTAVLINERLINFPMVPNIFPEIDKETKKSHASLKNVLYFQKFCIKEKSDGDEEEGNGSNEQPAKKKKKMGKAAKKAAAAAKIQKSVIRWDNLEDELLQELNTGSYTHFDYPVSNDINPNSQILEPDADGKKWIPYRRVVLMDNQRLNEFLEKCRLWAQ